LFCTSAFFNDNDYFKNKKSALYHAKSITNADCPFYSIQSDYALEIKEDGQPNVK